MSLTVMAWDTASTFTCAAIVRFQEDEAWETLAEFHREGGASHSQILPPRLEEMLSAASLSVRDINLLAIGRGPGSFTGLRTGLALAKGLAMGADIPLIGLSTLEVMAAEMIFEGGSHLAAPVIDARHKEIFTALYRNAGGGLALECLVEPQPVAPAAFADLIGGPAGGAPVSVAGNGLEPVEALLAARPNLAMLQSPAAPSAVMLARLAAHRLKLEGPAALSANPPLPMYIRQPDIRPCGIVFHN